MTAYYNEHDIYAAAWLRELIKAGEIAPGDVDERSITDVDPTELAGYTQLHFFAGVGGWSRALRLAGIPDSEPIVTGSCPCQPFSSAGKGDGFDDPRHLWPHFFRLISALRPARVVGEQVASPDALIWWDAVCADLEGAGYAGWAADLCSAGIGAPHIRQRLYWVADAERHGDRGQAEPAGHHRPQADRPTDQRGGCGGASGRLADANQVGREPLSGSGQPGEECNAEPRGSVCGLADADKLARQQGGPVNGGWNQGGDARAWAGSGGSVVLGGLADNLMQQRQDGQPGVGYEHHASGRLQGTAAASGLCDDLRPGPTNGFWRAADWLGCRDGKWRPVKPGLVPLVDGLPRGVVPSSRIGMAFDADKTAEARAMRLKGYGNAIDPELAAIFLKAIAL